MSVVPTEADMAIQALKLADWIGRREKSIGRETRDELAALREANRVQAEALRRIASFSMAQFASPLDMATECQVVAAMTLGEIE